MTHNEGRNNYTVVIVFRTNSITIILYRVVQNIYVGVRHKVWRAHTHTYCLKYRREGINRYRQCGHRKQHWQATVQYSEQIFLSLSHTFFHSLTLIFFLFLTRSFLHALNFFLSYTLFSFFRSLSLTLIFFISLSYTLFLAFSLLHTFLSFSIVNIVRLSPKVFSRRHYSADPWHKSLGV